MSEAHDPSLDAPMQSGDADAPKISSEEATPAGAAEDTQDAIMTDAPSDRPSEPRERLVVRVSLLPHSRLPSFSFSTPSCLETKQSLSAPTCFACCCFHIQLTASFASNSTQRPVLT